MIPESSPVFRCPACGSRFWYGRIASGNTFGATVYSDGYRAAPMLPDQPPLVACPQCAAPHWVDDLKPIDYFPPGAGGDGVTPGCRACSAAQWRAAAADCTDRERDETARQYAWWRENDRRRPPRPPRALSKEGRVNLEALLRLIPGEGPSRLLQRAEICRELGRWEEARAWLARITDPQYAQLWDRMQALIDRQDDQVRVFFPEGE
jgi:hypothetical protein